MDTPTETVRAMIKRSRETELSFLAGSIAFFAFLSIIPALFLVLAIRSVVGSEQLASSVVTLFQSYLSDEGVTVVREALTDQTGAVGASVFGGFALLWSTLKVFKAIEIAFGRVYGVTDVRSLPQQLLVGLVVISAIGTGIVLLLTVQIGVTRAGIRYIPQLGPTSAPIVLIGLLIAVVPLYYVMPPEPVTLHHIVPGTTMAIVGLITLQQIFQIYTTFAGQYQVYGIIGAVLLFLLWLYFGALVLLFGAVVNVSLATAHRSEV